jgi:hypothetical protein
MKERFASAVTGYTVLEPSILRASIGSEGLLLQARLSINNRKTVIFIIRQTLLKFRYCQAPCYKDIINISGEWHQLTVIAFIPQKRLILN